MSETVTDPGVVAVSVGKKKRPADKPADQLPQKRYFRQRAHSNPMSDHNFAYPVRDVSKFLTALATSWKL